MSSVADRRNQQIWDAIENDNLKQALQLCTKRLRKGERGDYLLALKAHVLALSVSCGHNDEGFADAHALALKDPPVTDVEVLRLLQLALSNLEARGRYNTKESITKLWERAIKAKPGDEALAREWFLKTFQDRDWRNTQKAAMSLQKTYSKKREYYFWAVLSSYLLYSWPGATESEKKLFGALAYRMISKAASDVPDDPKILLSPGRAIQTPHELHLLLSVYRQQGYRPEALAILNSDNLGTRSTVAKGDWSFVRQKIELLEEQELWESEWDFCKMLLDEAFPGDSEDKTGENSTPPDAKGDDWRIWQGFLTAAWKIDTEENRKSTIDRIQSSVGQSRPSRNARLALLDYLAKIPQTGQPAQGPLDLLSACNQYFGSFATKTCCFDDIRCYVEALEPSQRKGYLEHIRQFTEQMVKDDLSDEKLRAASVAASINVLKFDYLVNLSLPTDPAPSTEVGDFVGSCVGLYKSSLTLGSELEPTDNQHGDDACILAVMGLVRLAGPLSEGRASARSRGYLLQAAALLEFLVSRSRHNFQALLLLVRLYGLLGAYTLAMETYPRLTIKQIQNDTLAHNIFSRISTLHPYQAVGINHLEKGDRDPSLGLLKALMVYEKSATQVPDLAKMALEKGSFDQVEGFLEFADKVRNSICKVMWTVERRRIARLVRTKTSSLDRPDFDHICMESLSIAFFRIADAIGAPSIYGLVAYNIGCNDLDPLPDDITDNRDYEVMINCEGSDHPRFEEYVRLGPKPTTQWARAFHSSEEFSLYLARYSSSQVPLEDRQRILQSVEHVFYELSRTLSAGDEVLNKDLTTSEKSFIEIQALLAEELTLILGAGLNLRDIVTDSLQRVVLKIDERLSSFQAAEDLVKGFQGLDIKSNGGSNSDRLLACIPDWTFLHESYMTLQTLISLSAYTKHLETTTATTVTATSGKSSKSGGGSSGIPKNATVVAKQRVESLYQAIRARASKIKNQFSESGVVGALVDGGFGRDAVGEDAGAIGEKIEELVGEAWMEGFVGRVVESWLEGLDGVLRVKVNLD